MAWRWWIQQHHYLGYRPLVGESIRYVAFWRREPVALLGWASATLHNAKRDQFVGWDAPTRRQRLHLVVSNVRFLMLPASGERLFASRVLSANVRRLSADWQQRYAHPVWLAETFVDPSRFRGTCYQASNWICLGRTRGWSRSGVRYRRHDQPKLVFVCPLGSRALERLRDPQDPRGAVSGEENQVKLDVEKLPLQGKGGLVDVMSQIPDPRKKRGIRHSSSFLLAVATCAKLSGARSLDAIAQWAEDQPPDVLKRLGCRGGRPPSEPALRRFLGKIDAAEFDRRMSGWMVERTDLKGKGVAIDGKTLRGSRDGDAPGIHLLGATVHEEKLVIGQTRVSDKSNEIPCAPSLLQPLPLKGAVVTADAMHTQKDLARFVVEQKKADYLFTAKDNQPTLKKDIEDLNLGAFPPSAPDGGEGARSERNAPDLDE